jgi:cytochrome bd-type quinol oxidase subunit 2
MKILLLGLVLAIGVVSLQTLPAQAQFDAARDQACAGAQLSNSDSATCPTGSGDTVSTLLKDVINILSLIVGVISVIMVIIGGFKFVTSAGDSSKVSSARNTILYAIIGLVIVAFAQTIVFFVLRETSEAATPATTSTQEDAVKQVNCPPGQTCPQ